MRKGDLELISVIFAFSLAVLLIAIIAPFISRMDFTGDLSAIQKSSIEEFRPITASSAFIQNKNMTTRAANYEGDLRKLDNLRSRKFGALNQIDNTLSVWDIQWDGEEKDMKSKVERLLEIRNERGYGSLENMEEERKLTEEVLELNESIDGFERDLWKKGTITKDENLISEQTEKIAEIQSKIESEENNISIFRRGVEDLIAEDNGIQRFSMLQEKDNGEFRTVFEEKSDYDGNIRYSRFKIASPRRNARVIDIGTGVKN